MASTKSTTEKKRANLKRAFLDAYKKCLGNITLACENVGIDRGTYYNWIERDEAFRAEVEAANEVSIDFVENALMKQIKEGNTTATIFYLKTKGKQRGYVERQEVTGRDGSALIPSRMTDEEIQQEIERLKRIGDKE